MKSKKTISVLFTIICLLTSATLCAQDQRMLTYAALIDSANIRKTLEVLASDKFEGRGTGKPGGAKAVEYITEYLKQKEIKAGNKGSYLQNINAMNTQKGNKRFLMHGFDYEKDYSYPNLDIHDSIISADKIVFVGYGIYGASYNDFAKVDIADKVIMMIENEGPFNKYGIPYFSSSEGKRYIEKQRPKAILRVKNDFRKFNNYNYSRITYQQSEEYNEQNRIPKIEINQLLANKILQPLNKTIKQIEYETEATGISQASQIDESFTFTGNRIYTNAGVNNIIAIVEGTDLKEEYIFVTAHHDHEGTSYDKIYNGADDNASGVSAVLEIANVMNKAKKQGKGPRRSIVFLFPAAEEVSLTGSGFYTNHPVYPLKNTKACINLDMVGRLGDEYASKGNNYVYVVNHEKNSKRLCNVLENVNQKTTQLTLDYKYTTPGDNERLFHRSDQASFYEKGIPAIMLTSGMHKDYHKETDEAKRIDFNGLYKRTKLAFAFIWELANSPRIFPEETKTADEEKVEISVMTIER